MILLLFRLGAFSFGQLLNARIADRRPHEASDACKHMHCFSHQRDEPTPGDAYLICGECLHYTPSASAERRDHRHTMLRIYLRDLRTSRKDRRIDEAAADLFGGAPLVNGRRVTLRKIAGLIFIRNSKITFCSHCHHDL